MRFACFNAHTCVESSEVGQRDPKFWGQTKCADGEGKKSRQTSIITGSSLYLFKRALHLGGSDIVRRHARPAARLARRLEGEDLFAGIP